MVQFEKVIEELEVVGYRAGKAEVTLAIGKATVSMWENNEPVEIIPVVIFCEDFLFATDRYEKRIKSTVYEEPYPFFIGWKMPTEALANRV